MLKSGKGDLLKYNAVQSAFNVGFTALDMPWRSTHICRHTFATISLMETKNLSAVQASLGHTEQRVTQRYAKAVALLSSSTGEKTASAIFKNSRL
ncbi:MAG: tyrosine-type recombinase/integrase [Bdellovibrionales bacterium]|nr:tyrosine-type recombinase/integrase [Bdellovibrionales bacterium]